jgi:hypothetical protein
MDNSDGSVWVEHDSEVGSSGASGDVLGEFDSNHTGMSVGGHDRTPLNSISSVAGDGLNLVNIGNSLSEVEFGTLDVIAVLDHDQSLVLLLMILSSSETGEDSLLIESNWLGFVVDGLSFDLSISSFSFLYHSFSFVIMIIQ